MSYPDRVGVTSRVLRNQPERRPRRRTPGLNGTSLACGPAAHAGATNLAAHVPPLSTAGASGPDVASALHLVPGWLPHAGAVVYNGSAAAELDGRR